GESYKSGSKPAPLGVEDADLADLLTHANRWHRLQAQRLILEQQDTGFIPKLRSLLDSAEFDQARLHAFYALEGLGAMDFDLVRQALSDPYPGLREHGVIMAERFESALPFLLDRLDDEDIRVVFQACLSLGQFSDDQRVLEGLANVIKRHGTDPWFRLAVLSSHAGSSLSLLDNLLERQDFDEVDTMLFPFIQELGYVVARRRKGDEGPRFLDLLLATSSDNSDNWILRAKERFLEGVIHSGQKMHSGQRLNSILTEFQNSDSPRQRKLATDYQVL
ncbi:MAG: HEAT repeat domain-containing protein, partial [Saprospiraceae bacterium]|nr:HEAT repeat domain-containing protein [Saprospiraceae bacterium]